LLFFLVTPCYAGQFFLTSNPIEVGEPAVYYAEGDSVKQVTVMLAEGEFSIESPRTQTMNVLEIDFSSFPEDSSDILYTFKVQGKHFEKTGQGRINVVPKLSKKDISFREDIGRLKVSIVDTVQSIVSLNATLSAFHIGLYVLLYDDYTASLDAELFNKQIPSLQKGLDDSISKLEKRISAETLLTAQYYDEISERNLLPFDKHNDYELILQKYESFLFELKSEEAVLKEALSSYSILGFKPPFVVSSALSLPPSFTKKLKSSKVKQLNRKHKNFQKRLKTYERLLASFERVSNQRVRVSVSALESSVRRLDFGYLDVL
jgi:hypothetical protein